MWRPRCAAQRHVLWQTSTHPPVCPHLLGSASGPGNQRPGSTWQPTVGTQTLDPPDGDSPPEAATSPMDATTGFSFAVRWICRHIRSLASASPPGLSTRSTTAATPCRQNGACSDSRSYKLAAERELRHLGLGCERPDRPRHPNRCCIGLQGWWQRALSFSTARSCLMTASALIWPPLGAPPPPRMGPPARMTTMRFLPVLMPKAPGDTAAYFFLHRGRRSCCYLKSVAV